MALVKCRLCGMLYDDSAPRHRICGNCIRRLEELYGQVHEYMRDNKDDDFDIYTLADDLNMDTADIQALVDLGYIERDLQTYSRRKTGPRGKLAEELNNELEKMRKNHVMTYGGFLYARNKKSDRQYVYDNQKSFQN